MTSLPLAVTIGFSGPRNWYCYQDHAEFNPAVFQQAAADWLKNRLQSFPAELGLTPHHFLTGISQIAVGADQAFTVACRDLGIPQRLFLPQPSDAYLTARGSNAPDFTDEQKKETLELLESPHIIQERVVAEAADRHTRFEEANIELVRQSDVVIAMIKPGDEGKNPGGTMDVIRQARAREIPVLVVTVSLVSSGPAFIAKWDVGPTPVEAGFRPPTPPDVLEDLSLAASDSSQLPSKDGYFAAIKNHTSHEARHHSKHFENAAREIIGTHFFATFCAVMTLVFIKDYFKEGAFYLTLAVILGIELSLLFWGYFRHYGLHQSEAASHWATNRLVSEVARSALAFGRYHVGFTHLWMLNLPEKLRPLLRTMEILQLRETRKQTCDDWRDCRDTYLATRLTNPEAQLDFYHNSAQRAKRLYHLAHRIFIMGSIGAMIVTASKLALVLYLHFSKEHDHHEVLGIDLNVLKGGLGLPGILLPVIAVAALSLAAAHDLEARYHTFSEMHEFLLKQVELLKQATSEREFAKLLTETESRLLGETVTWFSRRSFTGVA